jgi:pSer/pThr/pTyr-binding forkhead associated (FHA) protein
MSVSREHLKLTVLEDGTLYATDVSKYGTWHNGRPMTKTVARPAYGGDTFSLSGPSGSAHATVFKLIQVERETL